MVHPPGLGRSPVGVPDGKRYEGLSYIQLRIPMDLHYAFREVLAQKRLSINGVAEDIIRQYIEYMKGPKFSVPGQEKRLNRTVRGRRKTVDGVAAPPPRSVEIGSVGLLMGTGVGE